MTWAFRSVGTTGTSFNANMTPGAPAGFQAGDFLAVLATCVPGSITIPDLTSQGFTRLSLNTSFSYCVLYGKIAVGSDTMPTLNMTNDFQECMCAAYTGGPSTLTNIASQTGVERGISAVNGFSIPAYGAPPDNNVLVLGGMVRGAGSATGVTFGTTSPYTVRSTYLTDSRPHVMLFDLIQTTAASSGTQSVTSSPNDSASQPAACELVFLRPQVAPFGMGCM